MSSALAFLVAMTIPVILIPALFVAVRRRKLRRAREIGAGQPATGAVLASPATTGAASTTGPASAASAGSTAGGNATDGVAPAALPRRKFPWAALATTTACSFSLG